MYVSTIVLSCANADHRALQFPQILREEVGLVYHRWHEQYGPVYKLRGTASTFDAILTIEGLISDKPLHAHAHLYMLTQDSWAQFVVSDLTKSAQSSSAFSTPFHTSIDGSFCSQSASPSNLIYTCHEI
jgi:hypothetical protein